MSVYLVRHAEDRSASEGRFGDLGLTERGKAQARKLGIALWSVPFVHCLCSPLRRAVETADLVLEGRDVATSVEASLAEGSIGELEGLSIEEGRSRFPAYFRQGHTVVARISSAGSTAPGGEPVDGFLSRVDRALDLVREALESERGPTLVVSHGGLLNYLLQRLAGVPVRHEVPFGFDHCGAIRLVRHTEEPAFGPFPMLRFGAP